MFEKKIVKILGILLVVLTFISFNTNVYGAINEEYYKDIVSDLVVIDGALDTKTGASVLLEAIGILVYAVGCLMEWVLGLVFQGISGSNVFPWADAVLFNAIPLLDINIFNPSGTSLVKIMQEFIASSYWTIFSLALSFLGIAIMVTAIKLVVSTIATDKAQYKQAIVKWLMAFVMLWGIHFFMAFVLYLNEALVESASKLAQDATKEKTIDLAQLRDTSQTDHEIVENFVYAMTAKTVSLKQLGGFALAAFGTVVAVAAIVFSGGTATPAVIAAFCAGTGIGAAGVYIASDGTTLSVSEFTSIASATISASRAGYYEAFEDKGIDDSIDFLLYDDTSHIAALLLKDTNYVNSLQATCRAKLLKDTDAINWNQQSKPEAVYYLAADVYLVLENKANVEYDGSEMTVKDYKQLLQNYLDAAYSIPSNERVVKKIDSDFQDYTIRVGGKKDSSKTDSDINYDESLIWYCTSMVTVRSNYEAELSGTEVKPSNVITTLAKTFKDMAWVSTDTSWTASKVTIQGALLYAILVGQSLIFFIAYTKRLFYVIILILLAPVVVIYDFFTRFPG